LSGLQSFGKKKHIKNINEKNFNGIKLLWIETLTPYDSSVVFTSVPFGSFFSHACSKMTMVPAMMDISATLNMPV